MIDHGLWASSRAGARAGRGFRFQDAVGAFLAMQIWEGALDATVLIPEGVDDFTLHGEAAEVRVQVKARHDPRSSFTTAELAAIFIKSASSVDVNALRSGQCRLVVVTERPAVQLVAAGWDCSLSENEDNLALLGPHFEDFAASSGLELRVLLRACSLVVIDDPIDRCVALLTARHACNDAIARLAAHRLRCLVGERADENYLASADNPATLGASDVDVLVNAVLGLLDQSTMFPAVASGFCEPVDFSPTDALYFYEGVDVTPGHVASGLVFDRPDLVDEIANGLSQQRRALISGPSGSGKSATVWLFAYQHRHAIRWYRVRREAGDQAQLLIQLARSLEASSERPVGFVFDDLGRGLSSTWNVLADQLRYEPGVLALSTVREEDLFLVDSLASTAIVRPALDEDLADRIWMALSSEREVEFVHWREPFQKSEGLLLEYTHLLTSGQRLQETVDQQVRRRLIEERDDELAILQAVVPAARFGGKVDADRLRNRVGLDQGPFARALARLVDEHTVRIDSNGSMSGLHQIRSAALYDALMCQMPRAIQVELNELVNVLCAQDFSLVLPQLMRTLPQEDEALLSALSGRVVSFSVTELSAIFHGLGLVTCDRAAAVWIKIVEDEGLDVRHATTAFTFWLVGGPPDIPGAEKLKAAVARALEVHQADLRSALLARMGGLPAEIGATLDDYHELAASLLPLPLASPVPSFSTLPAGDWSGVSLDEGLAVAATIREFGVREADRLLTHFGGSDRLLSRIHNEIAWVTRPTFEVDEAKIVISSNVRFIGDPFHADANAVVVRHCERLLAAVPHAEIAASKMLSWDGSAAGFEGHELAVKRISRRNLPSDARVAWNRAIMRIIQNASGTVTESGRANALASAITELADMLADAAEVYCRGIQPDPKLRALLSIRALLNTFIQPPSVELRASSARDMGKFDATDEVFDFIKSLTALASNLINKIERPVHASNEVAELRVVAEKILLASNWHWIATPPLEALRVLADTLHDLEAVLGDAHAHPEAFRRSQHVAERSSRHHRARVRFARDARDRADHAVELRAERIRNALIDREIEVVVVYKMQEGKSSYLWPRFDFSILIFVDNLTEYCLIAEEFSHLSQKIPEIGGAFIVPVCNGVVVAGLAGVIYNRFLPLANFADRWRDHLPFPLLHERAAAAFSKAVEPLLQSSAVFANIDRDLNHEETAYAEEMIINVESSLIALMDLRDTDDDGRIDVACALIANAFDRVRSELEGRYSERLSSEFARLLNGERSEFTNQIIACRIFLLERDILNDDRTTAAAFEEDSGKIG